MIDQMPPPITAGQIARGAASVPRKVWLTLMEHGRALEWLTAFVLLNFAITLALPGDTLAGGPAYRGFINLGLDEAALTLGLTILGVGRLAALYINGAWRRSPHLRAAGAMAGGSVFVMLAVTFGWLWITGAPGAPPGLGTGSLTYLTLGVFDFIAAYRSGADARATRFH